MFAYLAIPSDLFSTRGCASHHEAVEYASAAGDAPRKRSEAGLETPIWQAAGWPNQGLTSFAGSVEYAFLAGRWGRAEGSVTARETLHRSEERRVGNECG